MKRKTGEWDPKAAEPSRLSHLPPDSINPFSRSSGQLRQFSLAGLRDADPDPSAHNPLFPHRGVRRESLNQISGETQVPVLDELDKQKQGEVKAPAYGTLHLQRHMQILLGGISQCLDRGDVNRAARAYGIILQLQPDGRPIDVRRHNLWAIGAEILMREGEEPGDAEDGSTSTESLEAAAERQRWGSAANMSNVRAYFETLIQQHPYDYRRPNSVCAPDFWAALLRCEIYNIHAEHRIALFSTQDQDDGISLEESAAAKVTAARERARQRTLLAMRDLSFKIRQLVRDQPYAKDPRFHELLGAVSLSIADLALPSAPASSQTNQHADEEKQREREAARTSFHIAQAEGRRLDPVASAVLYSRADG